MTKGFKELLKLAKTAKVTTYDELERLVQPKCQHTKTYVAVRHVSGIQLVKCSDCGQTL